MKQTEDTTDILLFTEPPILAGGFSSILGRLPGFRLCGISNKVETLYDDLHVFRPRLLVAETTPGLTLEVLQGLRLRSESTDIVLWVDGVSPEFVSQAIGLGIKGVLRRNAALDLYERCLRSAAAGDLWMEQDLSCALLSARKVSLAPRQRTLMAYVAQGYRNKEIAWKMGITEGTVKVYLSHLFDRLGVSDRYELALLALKNLGADQSRAAEQLSTVHEEPPLSMAVPATLISRRPDPGDPICH